MMMQKFVAETYTEAVIKAKEELGEDILVVTSRVFQKKSWAGLYSQDMVEITAAVHRTGIAAAKPAPIRPMPTETIATHPQIQDRGKPRFPAHSHNPQPPGPPTWARPPEGGPSNHSSPRPPMNPGNKTVSDSYKRLKSSIPQVEENLKPAHTLRSNQERNLEPRSQRNSDDSEKSQKIQNLLGEILRKKSELLPKHEEISGSGNFDPGGNGVGFSGHNGNPSMKMLEEKFAEILGMLQNIQTSSNQALYNPCPSLPDGIARIFQKLKQMETPSEILDEIIQSLREDLPVSSQRSYFSARQDATTWFNRKMRFCPEPECNKQGGPVVIVFLGPTGVGKTTTIAKLAASYALNVMDRKSVALFTLDTFRIGAPAQLSQYAQIIEAGMEIVFEKEDIPGALERHKSKDVILVDTAGRCQKNDSELKSLKEFLSHFPGAQRYLVLSATTKYTDMIENIRKFGEIGYDHLIFTKVDETNSIGPLLGILYRTGFPLAYYTDGQSVPDDFHKGNIDFFLSKILPED